MPLELQQTQTRDRVYSVTYAFKKSPADAQDMAFGAQGLHTISPAELGMLREGIGNSPFTPYSRTNMDVVNDDRDGGRVVLARNAVITTPFLSDVVDAHTNGREFVIPEKLRDNVYDAIDTMLHDGRAFATTHGIHKIPTNRLGEGGITAFMYGDESLGITADKYGAWLVNQGRDNHSIFFDFKEYAQQKSGPYATRLRLDSPGDDFVACGYSRTLNFNYGAFGVLIEKADEGGGKTSREGGYYPPDDNLIGGQRK